MKLVPCVKATAKLSAVISHQMGSYWPVLGMTRRYKAF